MRRKKTVKINSKNGPPGLIFLGKISPTLKYLVRVQTKITSKKFPPGPIFPVLPSTTAAANFGRQRFDQSEDVVVGNSSYRVMWPIRTVLPCTHWQHILSSHAHSVASMVRQPIHHGTSDDRDCQEIKWK